MPRLWRDADGDLNGTESDDDAMEIFEAPRRAIVRPPPVPVSPVLPHRMISQSAGEKSQNILPYQRCPPPPLDTHSKPLKNSASEGVLSAYRLATRNQSINPREGSDLSLLPGHVGRPTGGPVPAALEQKQTK